MEEIKNQNDQRSIAAKLTAHVNNMCNAKTTEEVTDNFTKAKDILIELFKYNVNKVKK